MTTNTATNRTGRGPGAFTLVELMTVVVIVGILAATAIPAFGTLSSSRRAAAGKEVARLLLVARSCALASGRPTGLKFDAGSALTLVNIPTTGAAPTAMVDPMGQPEATVALPGLFDGVNVLSVVLGDSTSGNVTLWFAYDGTPQTRTSGGVLGSTWASDATITLTGGGTLTVRRGSGLIE